MGSIFYSLSNRINYNSVGVRGRVKILDIILIGIILTLFILAIKKSKKNKCIGCKNKKCQYKKGF